MQWQEIGPGVYVMRYEFFDQTIGLVVGDDELLVIDTRTTYPQARELQRDVRRVSPHPWTVVNTHHHFDHTLGNTLFSPAPIWGHTRCADRLRSFGPSERQELIDALPDLADDLAEVEVLPPDHTVDDEGATVEVGGRTIHLRYLGRGHTDNDMVVIVPDAGVVFAGDLVEQGAPPSFGDSYPLEWPDTNGRLLDLALGTIVPGHGEVVDPAFVEAQTKELARAVQVARAGKAAGRSLEDTVPESPFPQPYARACLGRAFAQLEGSLS